eukprot:530197-Prorocentrum_minimum.AAC.1
MNRSSYLQSSLNLLRLIDVRRTCSGRPSDGGVGGGGGRRRGGAVSGRATPQDGRLRPHGGGGEGPGRHGRRVPREGGAHGPALLRRVLRAGVGSALQAPGGGGPAGALHAAHAGGGGGGGPRRASRALLLPQAGERGRGGPGPGPAAGGVHLLRRGGGGGGHFGVPPRLGRHQPPARQARNLAEGGGLHPLRGAAAALADPLPRAGD